MRPRDIEIFSLSFLDLIFCSMAGVLVLYVTADRGEIDVGKPTSARQIIVTLPKAEGVVLPTDGLSYTFAASAVGWDSTTSSSNEGGEWLYQKEPPEGRVVIAGEVEYPIKFHLAIEDFNVLRGVPSSVDVQVTLIDPTRGATAVTSVMLTLDAGNNYAASHQWE